MHVLTFIQAFLLVFAVMFIPALLVHAEDMNTTVIENTVNVSADTGGNSGGTVSQGEAVVEIHVEQTVNGEAATPIHIVTSTGSGSVSASVEVKTVDASTTHEVHIERNNESPAQLPIPAEVSITPSVEDGMGELQGEASIDSDVAVAEEEQSSVIATIAIAVKNIFSAIATFVATSIAQLIS